MRHFGREKAQKAQKMINGREWSANGVCLGSKRGKKDLNRTQHGEVLPGCRKQ